MKFEKRKISALNGETEVRFVELSQPEQSTPFTLIASRSGLTLQGTSPTIEDQAQLEEFARTVSLAWTEHRKLVPNLSSTLSGH
jgi:hypothetical protein